MVRAALAVLTAPLVRAAVLGHQEAAPAELPLWPLRSLLPQGSQQQRRLPPVVVNEEDLSISIQFLQLSQRPVATAEPQLEPTDAKSQAARLEQAFPLAWVHVPKCGSSLANFMIHLPGVCPDLPEDVVISPEYFGPEATQEFRFQYHPVTTCHFFNWGEHTSVGENWEPHYKGHGFIMLRQPEQRILSGWHHKKHSWPDTSRPPANEGEYAEVVQGCAVRMLTRRSASWDPADTCGGRQGGPTSWAEVEEAIHRLRTGFAFVGLTDEWPLSMCLGHRMFGGRCRQSDFVDGRLMDREDLAVKNTTVVLPKALPWDVSVLHGFRDPYDGALYQAAQDIFRDETERFGVSVASCRPCFDEGGVSLSE